MAAAPGVGHDLDPRQARPLQDLDVVQFLPGDQRQRRDPSPHQGRDAAVSSLAAAMRIHGVSHEVRRGLFGSLWLLGSDGELCTVSASKDMMIKVVLALASATCASGLAPVAGRRDVMKKLSSACVAAEPGAARAVGRRVTPPAPLAGSRLARRCRRCRRSRRTSSRRFRRRRASSPRPSPRFVSERARRFVASVASVTSSVLSFLGPRWAGCWRGSRT